MTTACATPGCPSSALVRLKKVPLCGAHAHRVMENAETRGVGVLTYTTHDVQAVLLPDSAASQAADEPQAKLNAA